MFTKEVNKIVLTLAVLTVGVLFLINFVFAGHTVTTSGTTSTITYVGNFSAPTIYNFTVNNTDSGNSANITQVNVTLPTGWTLNSNGNGTSRGQAGFLITAGTRVAGWFNHTFELVSNNSGENKTISFWYNATGNAYGYHTINITSWNSSGAQQTLITVIANDTQTAPNVTISTASVVSRGNYSELLYINISINDSFGLPDRVYFNFTNSTKNSVAVNSTGIGRSALDVINASVGGNGVTFQGVNFHNITTVWWQASINTSMIPDGIYNITIWANDTYGNLNNSETIAYFVVDNTPPSGVTNFTSGNIISGGNYTSGRAFHINVTTTSAGFTNVSSVVFNFTNSTNGQNVSLSGIGQALVGNTRAWNVTFNTSMLADGVYNLTVHARDFAGNINATKIISNLKVDNSGPSISLAKDTAATGKNNVEIDITVTDSLTGINSTCASDRAGAGATISGSSGAQVLVESSLDCGSTYTYVVTCHDELANSASSTLAVITNSCSSGGSSTGSGSGGSGSSDTTWKMTYKSTEEEVTSGFSETLSSKQRVSVIINGETHHVGVKSLTTTKAIVEIASTPITVELAPGQDTKADTNSDGYYDLYVKLVSIVDNKATLDIRKINEAIPQAPSLAPEEEAAPIVDDQPTAPSEPSSPKGSSSALWIWILLILLVLVILVVWMIYNRVRLSSVSKKKKTRW